MAHSRWVASGDATFNLNPDALTLIKATDQNGIIDDDNAGTVKKGGEFCLELSSGSSLEVWAGAISTGTAVALFNRSPSKDTIAFSLDDLPGARAGASYEIFSVWSNKTTTEAGSVEMVVGAHDTALLLVSPVKN